jgi:hypothetical protein
MIAIQGCRSTRVDTVDTIDIGSKSILSCFIEIDAIEISFSELNQLIQIVISLKAVNREVITDYALNGTHLKARVWVKKITPFVMDNCRSKLESYFPQYKISIYSMPTN